MCLVWFSRSHNYGTPRTFNQAGVDFYTRLFQGVSGERGVANSDPIPEIIPAGPNYAHTGTSSFILPLPSYQIYTLY
jgi:hypothetical protein